MKKRIIAIITILITIVSMISAAPAATASGGFTDLKVDAYYYDAVGWAVESGITNGVSADRFDPNGSCTRAQVVSFLWRAAGCPSVTATNPFADVKSNQYYYHPVLWAIKNGITNGISANRFDPNGSCTRAQVVSFLWRAAGCPSVSSTNPFADVKSNQYYYNAVLWAVENGITNGVGANRFDPNGCCTRAQVVSFLHRFYNPLFAKIQPMIYKDNEYHQRAADHSINLAFLGKGEYFTFDIALKNQTIQPYSIKTSHVLINGERCTGWQSFTLNPGSQTTCHIYYSTMKAMQKAGSYTVEFYANEKRIAQKTFVVTNSAVADQLVWSNFFPIPSAQQIANYKNTNNRRSPYLYGWWDLGQNTRFTEYSVDFKADYLPIGTYCSLANFYLDLSPLEQKYSNIVLEHISGYAGFQHTDKEHKAIMSMWDIYATEKSTGKNVTLRPRVVSSNSGQVGGFTGEGEGAQCFPKYNWESNHWYRVHLKCHPDAKTGNTLITFYVCDLETMTWSTLCTYDTLIPNTCFTASAVFLENYLTQYAGQIRSLEIKNGKIRSESTGQWVDLDTMTMYVSDTSDLVGAYNGSYAFGSTGDRFWMITSGVGGDWFNNGLGQRSGRYTLK